MPLHPPFKAKTIVSWPGEEDGDLGFMENEVIEVFSIVDESWWSGRLRRNNAEGIFPKDYVEVLPETPASLPHSTSNLLIHTPKQGTPVKDLRSNTPTHYFSKLSPKRTPYADQSFDYDDYDTSYDDRRTIAKKGRSANKLVSSTNHPKHKHSYQHQEEVSRELAREREREIENFKLLQHQHSYQVKKVAAGDKRGLRSSRPHSQAYEPAYHKSASYNDVSAIGGSKGLFNNHTVESFSPERRRGEEDDLDEIARKRAQLELELHQLKQLERSTHKRRSKQVTTPQKKYEPYDPSSNSSYVSEDILSSKKNYHSREDLGKKLTVSDEDDDYELGKRSPSPPPPPPPKHTTPIKSFGYQDDLDNIKSKFVTSRVPFDADDFRFSGGSHSRVPLTDEEIFKLSTAQQEELKNSIKSLQSDVLNLSELSATSAGSFIRHKYEKEMKAEMQAHQDRLKGLSLDDENKQQLVDSVFQDKKKQPNIFKKFLTSKKGSEPNLIERKFQQDEEIDWATLKFDINRMNSLTSHDKQLRTRRIVKEEGKLVIKPLDYISEINTNEIIGEDEGQDHQETDDQIEALKADFGRGFLKIYNFMSNYATASDLNELISDISVKFNSSKLHQLRCVLIHMCKFNIIEEASQISQTKPKLNEVLVKGEATIYQLNYLFKKILDALRIPSELVLGFWKKPNEFYHNEHYIINHCWLSVLHEQQFYMVDLFCFKNGNVCNIRDHPNDFNEFYFLAKPLYMVSTHIPSIIDLQHVIPPIDQNVTFYLPRVYSGFYKSDLSFRNFNNALTRLKDSEFFELELEVPTDVELFSLIKTTKVTTNELSLCQIKWINNRRIAKIKAILPENESIGVLQIFSGPKGLQKHFDNIHELSVVIPLYHTGDYKPCKFVPRFPTVQSQNNDLYIKSPQTNKIVVKNSYNFEILQHPSTGLNTSSAIMNRDFKIVIESPSGKYFKLLKSDPSKPFGSYESNIKCQEVGLYRGLVIGDSGNSWYVFAQWDCVSGTVN
ncbi:uncharacterized protein CANTADRAFT_53184 [Suhomyces tanzawaensis NRRL Y-17324]|uniref:SH3 domain-containing protein n=1 Tax=Suhomyces tanzawaensis NRRL Y-17324 TaxID=984487 RepID=A0A1E4SGZ9_9ASCO|nr:uncharacterized protein CANTADRAFT_53184 [Suhomyces tanzawaensis NRRL Y-17324]ODV78766.1 hypothetical protein CANTADRAFT_53184 [Suhomyces tanzawaensis NRRL Y-17324]